MPAHSKFSVLLAIFLWASNSNTFTILSPVNGSQVRVKYLIRFEESMSKPMNEPSREPISKPTKRFKQDALLPGNFSSKGVIFTDQGQDNQIQSNCTDSSNTQQSNWQGPK
jgi:hypothetical protein